MDFFPLAIGVLFVLAIIDLSVGVSNDAVNFLNSAIGSRVASRRTILIVATVGIIAGAAFSSGIMEVARKGIFHPDMFTFAEIMIVFLAVMIADVLLLDLFNTFALPTSTTVSLVFELLGAATAVALIHASNNPDAPPFWEFINGRSALTIVSGIVISVGIAFAAGTCIQFVSRFLFTFEQSTWTAGMRAIWSALSLTVIGYFLFLKGLSGASFIAPEVLEYVRANTFVILVTAFGVWLLLAVTIQRAGGNPLVFVVLAGTFSLAMAFASNDLVNFVGVPLAGLESWRAWSASNGDPQTFMMSALLNPVKGNSLILLGAGSVMAVTLWFSSKARSVTQTEVTLARQDEGAERFRPGPVSRALVRAFLTSGDVIRAQTPVQWQTEIEKRFTRDEESAKRFDAPAFDLVRASVNLALASILIATATSLKLPLSTTFVSFMVAMGTSLADRAWGRDSAAYRVAGVLSVLTGWFITAAAAFLLAALFAALLSGFGGNALAVLLMLVAFMLYNSYHFHNVRSLREERARAAESALFESQIHVLQSQMSEMLEDCSNCIDLAIRGLLERNRALLDQAERRIGDVRHACERKDFRFLRELKRVQPEVGDRLVGHLGLLTCQQELFQSVAQVVTSARTQVLNAHWHLTDEVQDPLTRFASIQRETAQAQIEVWKSGRGNPQVNKLLNQQTDLLTQATHAIVKDLYSGTRPIRFTSLIMTLLAELADYVHAIDRVHGLWDNHLKSDG